jgi:hypothetical protein
VPGYIYSQRFSSYHKATDSVVPLSRKMVLIATLAFKVWFVSY